MIKAININKSFQNTKVIDKLSFDINKGDKVCFVAESGKGKSTLLNILMGLESLDSGEIIINNLSLNNKNVNKIREYITWLPQELNIEVKTAQELVSLMDLNIESVNEFMLKLALKTTLINQEFSSLSGGQKQRILLAICLSQKKSILILDEPTSALDSKAIKLLIEILKKEAGLTIISASHNIEWKNFCNNIISL